MSADADEPLHVLVGLTGSVAAIKARPLLEGVAAMKVDGREVEVRVVATEAARHFFGDDDVPAGVTFVADADEWSTWTAIGDDVVHIELRKWADVFVIAPLSANSMAKLAHGLCDNLVTCVARAWELGTAPLLVAPAMNTAMWNHPVTAANMAILHSWGIVSVPPVAKTLACGDVGVGAMAAVPSIVDAVHTALLSTLTRKRSCDDRRAPAPDAKRHKPLEPNSGASAE